MTTDFEERYDLKVEGQEGLFFTAVRTRCHQIAMINQYGTFCFKIGSDEHRTIVRGLEKMLAIARDAMWVEEEKERRKLGRESQLAGMINR